jgi:hypothetical protein
VSGRSTAADEAVIYVSRVKVGDSPDARLAGLPLGAIYGDGRVIRPAPQVAVEPGPALPALQVATLDSAGIDAVLSKAAEGGLVGADRELRMPTEQDPTLTAFDIFLSGERRRTVVESLAEVAADDARLSPQAREQRAAMNAVVAMLTDPAGTLPDNVTTADAPYEPTAVRVIIAPADEGQPAETVVEWPLTDLASLGEAGPEGIRCAVVEGEDWTTLKPVVEAADTATRWTSAGVEYDLRFRPLLPGESGC